MPETVFAHTAEGDKDSWQLLQSHLQNVAATCEQFAREFDDVGYAAWCGWLHDIGKVSKEFQKYLEKGGVKVDHSTAGWILALSLLLKGKSPFVASIVGFPVAGHHTGLPNGGYTRKDEGSLLARQHKKNVPDFSRWKTLLQLPESCINRFPAPVARAEEAERGFATSFFIRMLFSCLTDADYLDTEQFCDPQRAGARPSPARPQNFLPAFDAYMAKLGSKSSGTIHHWRNAILDFCRQAGILEKGIFSLTVPTGGGKTLSSLAFALEHAKQHGFRRIIYVIPFTSIIEQNAAVFEKVLGAEAVLQHHCTYDADTALAGKSIKELDFGWDEAGIARLAMQKRLASENWEATLVVTTAVQFFESLYARKSSRCRKLHNIANSVVILDEAQMLPTELLNPSVRALKELAASYGSSIVLCTATQPSLGKTEHLRAGFDSGTVREIIPQNSLQAMFDAFRRVAVRYAGPLDDAQVVDALLKQGQGLCIVNTRKHARQLFETLSREEGHYHLSALMYPAHRTRILDTIRERLQQGKVCRVISTSLVEAGVDVDFPLVLRALSGLDSIAQAAGRCNREGRLATGEVVVFKPPEGMPKSPFFARRAYWAESVMETYADVLSPEAITTYFNKLYSNENLDRHGIVRLFNDCIQGQSFVSEVPAFPFADVAHLYRFIDDASIPVIVEVPEAAALVDTLEHSFETGAIRRAIRGLQAYTVSVYPYQLALLQQSGTVRLVKDLFYVHSGTTGYCKDVGLMLDDPTFLSAESSVL